MATTCSDPAVMSGLFLAAYSGNLADVKSVLKTNALSADVADTSKGSTALLWASSGGSLEVVEWLVKQGGANAGHRNKDNRSALFFACEHCHKPVADFLVGQAGVDVNAKDGPSGHTPLHRACIAGQTREEKKAGATKLISWLLTSAKADAKATDLGGRMPGEADLTAEAPSLKPTSQAGEITDTLANARSGGAGTTSRGTRAAPAAAAPPSPKAAAATERVLPKPASIPSARPATTLASARAAAAAGKSSPSNGASAARPGSPPATTAASSTRAATASPSSPSRVALRAAALAEKTKAPAASESVKPSFGVSKPTAAAASRSFPDSSPGATATASPPRSPSRAAATAAAKTARVPSPSSPKRGPGVSSSRSAALSSPRSGTGSGARSGTSPSRSSSRSPRSGDTAAPSWASKKTAQPPRAGGVLPRAGGPLPAPAVTSGSSTGTGAAAAPGLVKQSSYGLRSGGSASNGNSSGSASPPSSNASAAATTIKPGLVKQSSYLLRTNSASNMSKGDGSGSGVGPSPAPPAAPSSSSSSSSGVSRYERPASSSTAPVATTNAATGNAAAVIGASSRPKASALRAAFENKARGGTAASTTAGSAAAQQRGSPGGMVGSGKQAVAGGSRSGSASSSAAQRSSPPQPTRPLSPSRVTPESLLGKGTVMQRTKVYTAAAQKSGQGGPGPMLGKGKKDGSFMDKFVSMFSISPQSSPASSPQRSSSRSPRSKQRSPMSNKVTNWGSSGTNGSSSTLPDEDSQPRMGFFSTNKSFQASTDARQIATEKE